MTNVLFKTSINDIGKAATDEDSVADFTYALDVLEGKQTLYGCDDAQVLRVKALTRSLDGRAQTPCTFETLAGPRCSDS
jgi:hypothetical protein